jgi:predicted transporter
MANIPGKRAFFTVIMTVWLAAAVIFAGVYVIAEYDHEHIDTEGRHVPAGENCHICLEIQIALRIMEAFGRLGVCFLLAGFMTHAASCIKPRPFFFAKKPIELLKVRFNC